MKLARLRRYSVGLTITASTDPNNAIWSNGMGQNILFLAQLFQRLDIVESVSLVICPSGDTHPIAEMFGIPCISLAAAAETLDVFIEIGARGAEQHHIQQIKRRGAKFVSYVAGNVFVMNLEEIARGNKHGDSTQPSGWDAVWMTPQHWRTNRAYMELTRSKVVREIPHIWEPTLLNTSAAQAKRNLFYRTPSKKSWVVGCFDPNINVVKTFHLPMLVTENAYRNNPQQIERLLLFGAEHLKNSVHVTDMIRAMSLGRDNKLFVEIRHKLADVIGQHCNAVVAHQWENNLNYLYWEILYLGWPLIHNSTAFSDVGYYYPEFDPIKGGQVMNEGLAQHPDLVRTQAGAVRELLWGFSIENPVVQARHEELIEELFD
jgi:Protein of unknown function (DUF2827)